MITGHMLVDVGVIGVAVLAALLIFKGGTERHCVAVALIFSQATAAMATIFDSLAFLGVGIFVAASVCLIKITTISRVICKIYAIRLALVALAIFTGASEFRIYGFSLLWEVNNICAVSQYLLAIVMIHDSGNGNSAPAWYRRSCFVRPTMAAWNYARKLL